MKDDDLEDEKHKPNGWTWVWASSRSWWWTGRPGVLQPVGSRRAGHNWATELELADLHTQLPTECMWKFHKCQKFYLPTTELISFILLLFPFPVFPKILTSSTSTNCSGQKPHYSLPTTSDIEPNPVKLPPSFLKSNISSLSSHYMSSDQYHLSPGVPLCFQSNLSTRQPELSLSWCHSGQATLLLKIF